MSRRARALAADRRRSPRTISARRWDRARTCAWRIATSTASAWASTASPRRCTRRARTRTSIARADGASFTMTVRLRGNVSCPTPYPPITEMPPFDAAGSRGQARDRGQPAWQADADQFFLRHLQAVHPRSRAAQPVRRVAAADEFSRGDVRRGGRGARNSSIVSASSGASCPMRAISSTACASSNTRCSRCSMPTAGCSASKHGGAQRRAGSGECRAAAQALGGRPAAQVGNAPRRSTGTNSCVA